MKVTCLTCKRPFDKNAMVRGRCPRCAPAHERARDKARDRDRPQYRGAWRQISRNAIKNHVMQHGYVCLNPGCKTLADPHGNPLVCDHIQPGSLEQGVRVICRACNSRKGATTDRRKRRR